jgi:methylisocitrate lyase
MNERSPSLSAGSMTAGQRFRHALSETSPLPIVGTINPYCAMMAERVGHKAMYLAGGGIATYSYGMPDLVITTLNDVLTDVRRITDACSVPLMVDVDTGFGGAFNIARLVKGLIKELPHARALFGLDRRDAAMSENGQTQPIAALILHP